MSSADILEFRLKLSGLLLLGGLVIEAVTLFWSHPFSIMIHIFPGVVLMAAGIIFYLYSLVAPPPGEPAERGAIQEQIRDTNA